MNFIVLQRDEEGKEKPSPGAGGCAALRTAARCRACWAAGASHPGRSGTRRPPALVNLHMFYQIMLRQITSCPGILLLLWLYLLAIELSRSPTIEKTLLQCSWETSCCSVDVRQLGCCKHAAVWTISVACMQQGKK